MKGCGGIAKIMGSEDGKIRLASKRGRPSKNATKKAHKIMARTHISHARLLKIIDSYARWMTVVDTAELSGVSRVTVGRVFNLIRKRLLDTGIYESEQSYREGRYDAENEDGAYFYEDEWVTAFAAFMGRYRGVDEGNRHLYEAEAVFRLTNPLATAADVRAYIHLAIRRIGPLNEEGDTNLLALLVLEEKLRRMLQGGVQVLRILESGGSLAQFKTDQPWLTGRPYRVD